MPTPAEQQATIDHLQSLLRDRDVAESTARTERETREAATASATTAATRAEAASAERERIRRGAFVNAAIAAADPSMPFDFANVVIPDGDVWPQGTDPSMFAMSDGAAIRAADNASADVANTTMGKMLLGLAPKRI